MAADPALTLVEHVCQTTFAALRNTVIGLIRWAGHTNIAAACRRFAAQPQAALHLIGIVLENCMTLTRDTRACKYQGGLLCLATTLGVCDAESDHVLLQW